MKTLTILLSVLIMLLAACTPLSQASGQPTVNEPIPLVLTPQFATPIPGTEESQPPVIIQFVDINSFNQQLADAIVSQDLAAMRNNMGNSFILAYWGSGGNDLPVDEAMSQLQQLYFLSGADPVTDFSIDVTGLLNGSDPLNFFGPEAVRAFHITGMGPGADQQGIGIIGQDLASDRLYWRGLLMITGKQELLGDFNSFAERLAQALAELDFNALRSMMGERFAIASWNIELLEKSSDDALKQLSQGVLAAGSSPKVVFDSDVPALLGGTDPLSLWGFTEKVVRAFYVTGLGEGANQEAIIVIGYDKASNQFYWHGILLPVDGFFDTHNPEPGAVTATDIQYVMTLDDMNMRSGPGLNYGVEGLMAEGQVARVSGRSVDGNWWRIVCTQDASGFCWISADPQWTQPTTAP
jgi:hypothetical protein